MAAFLFVLFLSPITKEYESDWSKTLDENSAVMYGSLLDDEENCFKFVSELVGAVVDCDVTLITMTW